MDCKPTLNDWVQAHRELLQEETKLMLVAEKVASRRSDVAALQDQQARLLRTREHADQVAHADKEGGNFIAEAGHIQGREAPLEHVLEQREAGHGELESIAAASSRLRSSA